MEALVEGVVKDDPFHIAVVDMRMPHTDGETLGRQIKADQRLSGTALVMMTSYGMRGDAQRTRDAGFAAYLVKPLRKSQLRDCLAAVCEQKATRDTLDEPPLPLITRHSLAERSRRKHRILLAEDNLVNQKVALATLQKLGYSADAVGNGLEALAALGRTDYDLVLMDVQMPEMDGLDTTRLVRGAASGARNSAIPIVALTAHATARDKQECMAAGMNDYLVKPVRPTDLAQTLTRWLTRPPSKQAASAEAEDPGGKAVSAAEKCPPDEVVFDGSLLLELLDGDVEAAREILNDFLEEAPRLIASVREAVEAGDSALARRQAHTLKGASANTGANALRSIATRVERLAAEGNIHQVSDLTRDLERAFACLVETVAMRS